MLVLRGLRGATSSVVGGSVGGLLGFDLSSGPLCVPGWRNTEVAECELSDRLEGGGRRRSTPDRTGLVQNDDDGDRRTVRGSETGERAHVGVPVTTGFERLLRGTGFAGHAVPRDLSLEAGALLG